MSKSKPPWREKSSPNSDDDSQSKKRRIRNETGASGSGDVGLSFEPNPESKALTISSESQASTEYIVNDIQEDLQRIENDGLSSSSIFFEGYGYVNSIPDESLHEVDDPMIWGPYLSERQWGTVREDYSEDGNCWQYFSYEDATRRAFAAGEDGLLGICDRHQLLCASLALWNGKDVMLKERLFGLTGWEGNHGEDVKELYYYLDNMPDHSYMKALYKYPQKAFPYEKLREENQRRTPADPEFELIDTGVFEDSGHWDVVVEYARNENLGVVCRITVLNNSRREEHLHVIPQFVFRNFTNRKEPLPPLLHPAQPLMLANGDGSVFIDYSLGEWQLDFFSEDSLTPPELLFTNNISANQEESTSSPVYSKDAFHRYIVKGDHDAVNPKHFGTKCGAVYQLKVCPGSYASIYWKIEPVRSITPTSISDLRELFTNKKGDADMFFDSVMLKSWNSEEQNIVRQAVAGLLWSKQYYFYNIRHWIEGFRKLTQNKTEKVRNANWKHLRNHDILLMPDKWEFPWYAGWDLAIQVVLFARFDIAFAKHQMLTYLSDRYMHPRGQLPACEFNFCDANPPLHAWACLRIFYLDGKEDIGFLKRCFNRLLLNYGWWCSLEHKESHAYGRGFMGLDNISAINRSGPLPSGWELVQADCSSWMACFCIWLLQMAVELSCTDATYLDLVSKFLIHFLDIASSINRPIAELGLWHEQDNFYYDVFHTPDGLKPIELRSMSGLVPLFSCAVINLPKSSKALNAFRDFLYDHPNHVIRINKNDVFLSLVPVDRLEPLLQHVFSENEFLARYGIRSLSKKYQNEPYKFEIKDEAHYVHYTPGESDSRLFGGNSNWRGPVWLCMNYLLLESLDVYLAQNMHCKKHIFFNQPAASGKGPSSLPTVIKDLEKRLLSIFLPDQEGRRPVHGPVTRYASDPKWQHLVLFYEYFHADTGRGCGASHQTGWTALVVEILHRLHAFRKTNEAGTPL